MAFIYKYGWETSFQWTSRLGFIETHKQKFGDERRLASLSNAWSNWKFHGCRYSPPVQSLLAQLDSELPKELRDSVSQETFRGIAFKKATNEAEKAPTVPLKDVLIKGLTLYIPCDSSNANPICILTESAAKSGKILEVQDLGWKQQDNKTLLHTTAFCIDGKFIASGTGTTKKSSKHSCAEKVLEILQKTQPTMSKIRPNHDAVSQVEKTDLVKESYEKSQKIDESNIGNKMLRKMGWTGVGGLSKTGISDPVFVNSADGRKGLGHETEPGSLKLQNVEDVLMNFIRQQQEGQMKFSNGLSRTDRAIVHKLCQKYSLGHKSFGKGEDRYLVITKRI